MGIKDIVLHSNTRWGGSRLAAAGFALALLIAPGWAQRYLAAQDGWMDSVSVVDTNAGALFDFDLITLSGTADPPPSQTYDAQVVGGEIWVSSGQYVYRYDGTSLNFLCAIGPLGPARGIEVLGDRVWVAAGESLHEFATDGSRRATYAVPNAYDVLHWNGELLVSNRVDDTIDRYSLFGKFLGVFADSDTPSGALFQPGQLARRSRNWNLLVAGGVRIFEIDPSGVFIGEYQAGALEQGVQEMADGRLLVTLINGAVIFDPTTGALTPVHGATGRSIRFLRARARITSHSGRPSPPLAALRLFRVSSRYASSARLARSTEGLPGMGTYYCASP